MSDLALLNVSLYIEDRNKMTAFFIELLLGFGAST